MIVRQFFVSLFLMIIALQCTYAAQAQLQGVRRYAHEQGTRFVFDLSAEATYRHFNLYEPQRFVLDFYNVKKAPNLSDASLTRQAQVTTRSGVRSGNDLRLVFDMSAEKPKRVFILKPDAKHSFARLVVDFAKPIAAIGKKAVKPVLHTPWKQDRLRDVVVVIDPGHGGKDPGALGAHHAMEKRVVLAISKELYRLINQQSGMRAILTRNNDTFLTLRQRLRNARNYNADIFISIHADAYRDKRARGSSVYALSQRAATSEAARWLAAKENYSELGGVQLSNKSNLLRSVLLDLSQTATIGSSLQLGNSLLSELGKITRLHRRRVEQAPFVVLKSPDIPSVLVETGFLSNPSEAKRLRESWYQKKIAQALLVGIKKYFVTHPPPGSFLAKRNPSHRVSRGETLSGIAERYGVSTHALRELNNLKSMQINVGQILKIPNQRKG